MYLIAVTPKDALETGMLEQQVNEKGFTLILLLHNIHLSIT